MDICQQNLAVVEAFKNFKSFSQSSSKIQGKQFLTS
jgi:hypothetical protein